MNPNNLNRFAYGLATVLGILMVVGFALALLGVSAPLPPGWLVNWTEWLLSAVGLVSAPLALVTAVQAVRKYAGLA
jgi:hypothetical protein